MAEYIDSNTLSKLRAMQDRGGENYVKKEVRMATKDFRAPYGY